jgi:hypothetical protein
MSDILYPLSVCGSLVVLAKRDFQLVALNESGRELATMNPMEEIGYVVQDRLNLLTAVKAFPDTCHAPKKRTAEGRELRELQDAQLALELERYLHGVERSFVIEELRPAWYPVKMLADVLQHRAEFELSDIEPVQLAADLIAHADHLLRRNLAASELCLPGIEFKADAGSPAPSASAARLVLDYLEKVVDSYAQAHTSAVAWRVEQLLAG